MEMLSAAKQLFPGSALVAALQPEVEAKPRFRVTGRMSSHGNHPILVASNGEECTLHRSSDGRLQPRFVRKVARRAYEQELVIALERKQSETGKFAERRKRERGHYIAWLKEGLPTSSEKALAQRPKWMSEKLANELIAANYVLLPAKKKEEPKSSVIRPGAFNRTAAELAPKMAPGNKTNVGNPCPKGATAGGGKKHNGQKH